MANPLPNSLALTTVNDGAQIIASDHRNNYSAIQSAVNLLRACLGGGVAGQVLQAVDGTDVQYIDPRLISRYLASGQKTSNVSTVGTTFAAGADLLAAALSFTADGTSTYILRAYAPLWDNATAANDTQLHLNLDGADAGIFAEIQGLTVATLSAVGVIGIPTAGVHTINARLVSPAGTSSLVAAGNGGSGVRTAILLGVERL